MNSNRAPITGSAPANSPTTGPAPLGEPNSAPESRARHADRKPAWLKVPLPGGQAYARLKDLTRRLNLHTVCEEARCPNIGECWKGQQATMTLMVLGDECTRRCRFCAVKTVDRGAAPDPAEPEHVGVAVGELDLGYVVITSVDRDDLTDGGAGHYAACIESIRAHSPRTVVETLIPDYADAPMSTLMAARPDVLSHNVEVVSRLQRKIRDPRCSFERSLQTLEQAKLCDASVLTKSSLMVGLGERHAEVLESMRALRDSGVDFLTIGQYLRPTQNHAPVKEYVEPAVFEEYQREGLAMGFGFVASGPLVRSSYKAGEFFAERLVRQRRSESSEAVTVDSAAVDNAGLSNAKVN